MSATTTAGEGLASGQQGNFHKCWSNLPEEDVWLSSGYEDHDTDSEAIVASDATEDYADTKAIEATKATKVTDATEVSKASKGLIRGPKDPCGSSWSLEVEELREQLEEKALLVPNASVTHPTITAACPMEIKE